MTTWNEPPNLKYGTKNQGETTRQISRSGNVIGISDEVGNEFVQFQHRTGTKFEMRPNGDMVIKALKDAYQITLGDNKVLISGHNDVTIQGGGSLKVRGDYEMRITGNMTNVVEGDFEMITMGKHNTVVKGNQEVAVGGNQITKVLGGIEHSADGMSYYAATLGLGLGSDRNIGIDAGRMIIAASGTDTFMTMGATFKTTSTGTTTMKAPLIELNP